MTHFLGWHAVQATEEDSIVTLSHIDAAHAASSCFPAAESTDGRFGWMHAQPDYVRVRGMAQPVYLQYPPQNMDPAILAEANRFVQAVECVRLLRQRQEEEQAIAKANQERHRRSSKTQRPCPHCGTYCYGDCRSH